MVRKFPLRINAKKNAHNILDTLIVGRATGSVLQWSSDRRCIGQMIKYAYTTGRLVATPKNEFSFEMCTCMTQIWLHITKRPIQILYQISVYEAHAHSSRLYMIHVTICMVNLMHTTLQITIFFLVSISFGIHTILVAWTPMKQLATYTLIGPSVCSYWIDFL